MTETNKQNLRLLIGVGVGLAALAIIIPYIIQTANDLLTRILPR